MFVIPPEAVKLNRGVQPWLTRLLVNSTTCVRVLRGVKLICTSGPTRETEIICGRLSAVSTTPLLTKPARKLVWPSITLITPLLTTGPEDPSTLPLMAFQEPFLVTT